MDIREIQKEEENKNTRIKARVFGGEISVVGLGMICYDDLVYLGTDQPRDCHVVSEEKKHARKKG